MKPLFVLLIVFGITAAISKIFYHQWNSEFAGNLAMGIMLFFSAMAHFVFNKGMAMMLPRFIPFKKVIVYITGLIQAYNICPPDHIFYIDPACKCLCSY